jgi:hypothetical protein
MVLHRPVELARLTGQWIISEQPVTRPEPVFGFSRATPSS